MVFEAQIVPLSNHVFNLTDPRHINRVIALLVELKGLLVVLHIELIRNV
jgi:hypothetical protein